MDLQRLLAARDYLFIIFLFCLAFALLKCLFDSVENHNRRMRFDQISQLQNDDVVVVTVL